MDDNLVKEVYRLWGCNFLMNIRGVKMEEVKDDFWGMEGKGGNLKVEG